MKNFGIFCASILLGLSLCLSQTIVVAEKTNDRSSENSTVAELSTEKTNDRSSENPIVAELSTEKTNDRSSENPIVAELSTGKSPIAPPETSNILPSYSQIYSTYLPPIYAPPPVYVGPTITTYYPPAAPVYIGPPVVVRPWRPFLNAFLP